MTAMAQAVSTAWARGLTRAKETGLGMDTEAVMAMEMG